jgi:hypothetical protein
MTNTEIKAFRKQIDQLNKARIALQMSGSLSDKQSVDLLEIVEDLEDRFIDVCNKARANSK